MKTTATARIDFSHEVGIHCSSTSLRNVLRYDGVGWSEALVFGLGSGLGFYYKEDPDGSPRHRFNGRAPRLLEKFFDNLDRPVTWRPWNPAAMADALARGRPVIAESDIYHLPYYRPRVHFPAHGIVVTGVDLDAGSATIADIAGTELQSVTLEQLRAAMGVDDPPLLAPDRWAAAPPLDDVRVTPEAIRRALRTIAGDLLNPADPRLGYPAMEKMAQALPSWADGVPEDEWRWAARFGYQAIAKRGTAGGAFRTLFADFLAEAATWLPELRKIKAARRMREMGARWAALGHTLKAIFVEADAGGFARAGEQLAEIADAERALVRRLRDLAA